MPEGRLTGVTAYEACEEVSFAKLTEVSAEGGNEAAVTDVFSVVVETVFSAGLSPQANK